MRLVASHTPLAEGEQSIIRAVGEERFHDPEVVRLLETGLVVTYMRLFTRAEGYGTDGRIPVEWVPAEHLALHRVLVERRHKHEAHTDGRPPLEHRRSVSEDQPGWIAVSFPDRLTTAAASTRVWLGRWAQPCDQTCHA